MRTQADAGRGLPPWTGVAAVRPRAWVSPAATSSAHLAGPVLRPWLVKDPAPAATYRPAEPVWIWSYECDGWLPGEVGFVGDRGLLVRYELPGGGAATDTVRPEYVQHRDPGSWR